MSTELNLEEIEARCSAGREMVSNLCKRRGEAGSREWVMSIPARPEHDPDLVIGASLHDIPALCEEVRRLREEQAHDKETIQVLGLKLAMAEKETETLREELSTQFAMACDLAKMSNEADDKIRDLRDWQTEAVKVMSLYCICGHDLAHVCGLCRFINASDLEGGK